MPFYNMVNLNSSTSPKIAVILLILVIISTPLSYTKKIAHLTIISGHIREQTV